MTPSFNSEYARDPVAEREPQIKALPRCDPLRYKPVRDSPEGELL